MAGWFVLNCLQAALLGLDGDEAYYWMLSQQPAWGYFDHPPFVALLMRAGELLGHGPFFTRLGTVLLTSLSIGIIYAGLPPRLQQPRYYLTLFAATLIFNVYSFIATPDAPLFFFASLFFYAYRKYLERVSVATVLLMSFSIAGMFYSKYHGILPVAFTVLSNLKLLKKSSFWLIVLLVTILFLPHLYWQYQHDWPTVRFHLLERANHQYKLKYTTNYLLGQLLIWGPVISLLFYSLLGRLRKSDDMIRAHQFTFLGVLALFLISSFRNNVQPHWTLVAGISFITLFLDFLDRGSDKLKKLFFRLAYINIAIIIVARVLFLLPQSPFANVKNYKPFFQGKAWADAIYTKTGHTPVLFTNSYVLPSLYRFYHPDAVTIGYNTKSYRKTNYNIDHSDRTLDGRDIWWYQENGVADSAVDVSSSFKKGILVPLKNFTAINDLSIKAIGLPDKLTAGQSVSVDIELRNTGNTSISTAGLRVDYSFSEFSYKYESSAEDYPLPDPVLAPGYSKRMTINLKAPAKAGKYRLLFSFKNGPLEGNFASPYYAVTVQ